MPGMRPLAWNEGDLPLTAHSGAGGVRRDLCSDDRSRMKECDRIWRCSFGLIRSSWQVASGVLCWGGPRRLHAPGDCDDEHDEPAHDRAALPGASQPHGRADGTACPRLDLEHLMPEPVVLVFT